MNRQSGGREEKVDPNVHRQHPIQWGKGELFHEWLGTNLEENMREVFILGVGQALLTMIQNSEAM